jgi:hypothetical protein
VKARANCSFGRRQNWWERGRQSHPGSTKTNHPTVGRLKNGELAS